MLYALRVLCGFVGGVLASIGLITALAVLFDVHPEGSRWAMSQAFAGVGVGMIVASRIRGDEFPPR